MPSEIPWAKETPQQQGRSYERLRAKKLGAKLHPASGAVGSKGDYSTEDTVYEQKVVTAGQNSHSVNGKKLNALLKDALAQGKDVVYTIYFEDCNLTLEGTVRRGQ